MTFKEMQSVLGRPCGDPAVLKGVCKKGGDKLISRARSDRTRGDGFKVNQKIGYVEEIVYADSGEMWAQVA